MLRKNVDIEISREDPFRNDCLDRGKSITNLTTLIGTITQPFVMSIEAPWGHGKTTFIRLWQAYLEGKGCNCLYFNAWINDFAEDPLISFISEIGEVIKKHSQEENNTSGIRKAWDNLKRIGGGVIRKTAPVAIQIATQGLLSQQAIRNLSEAVSSSGEGVANFLSDLAKKRIEQYEEEKKGIEEFKSNLETLAAAILDGEENKSPLIFFIDELDRCRPDYAIALLERIKHLFSVRGVVFILAIDRQQVMSSIKSIYGSDMDADGYIRRFIDLSYSLPPPNVDAFAKFLYKRFNWDDFFDIRQRWKEDSDIIFRTFPKLAKIFNLSLRMQEQCFIEINLVIRTSEGHEIHPHLLPFLVIIRAKQPEVFRKLQSNRVIIKEILEVLRINQEGKEFLESYMGVWIEAHLIHSYRHEEETKVYIKAMREKAEKKETLMADRSEKIFKILEHLDSDSDLGACEYLISRLEITRNFNQ